jgi:predicted peptidase
MKTRNRLMICIILLATALFGIVTSLVVGLSSRFAPPEKMNTRCEKAQITGENDYVTCIYTDATGVKMTYYLHVPGNYDPQQRYPLILFLHGVGERLRTSDTPAQNRELLLGQDYLKVLGSTAQSSHGLNVQTRWPSFIVVPQVLEGQRWVNIPSQRSPSYKQEAQSSDSLRRAKEIVDTLQQEYPGIDADRLYITGLSMGGDGTWDAIERWSHYFAAAIPVAGAGDPSKASVLADLPLWAFHGAQDTNVPVGGSREMIEAIRAAGGHPCYTEYADADHPIWGRVYSPTSNPNLFLWLFSQSRSAHCSHSPYSCC